MEERISRTAGNMYEKIDKDTWMVFPTYEEKRYTSFVDASKITISEKNVNLDDIDMQVVLDYIMQMDL